jgi:uncharacterized protein
MASGLSDRVDCARLAEDAASLERVYPLRELPRVQDLLSDTRGSMQARFNFTKFDAGRARAVVAVHAVVQLICQRCLQGFAFPIDAESEIEFVSSETDATSDSQREMYVMDEGSVSLRELAEEELLLALPVIAACSTPETCGRAAAGSLQESSRPFADLQNLLKKT